MINQDNLQVLTHVEQHQLSGDFFSLCPGPDIHIVRPFPPDSIYPTDGITSFD